ncbi:MAG: isoprenoid biosynthesis glyoxalase ElbB [Desulfobacteraceae bacterium]|nr:isoprenoid biosynthesis glyoxalase ElbB [Desulfobacteraceae bacterium]
MNKKVGLLLSGCGVFDGSEIHEAVITMLALDKAGVEIVFMAPDIQYNVINHFKNKNANEQRNALVEASRISRGKMENIKNIKSNDIDALILPGGAGAIKNLSNFADKGADADINPEVARLIFEMNKNNKTIGAICISPVVAAKVLSHKNITVTIGNDKATASIIESMGCTHVDCTVDEIVIDQANKVVTTPAYMLGPGIKDIAIGIEKLVEKVVSMI